MEDRLPTLSDREILEGYTKDQLVDYVTSLGARIRELQELEEEALTVLEGSWNTTLEQELEKRKTK